MKKVILIFLGLSALSACNKTSGEQYILAEEYFDIPTFISTGLEQIQAEDIKKSSFDGTDSEVLTIGKADMLTSLKFLERIDINKSAWQGKFKVDTLRPEGAVLNILYTSNDEKINIKEVRIIDNEGDGKIDACTIIKKTESPLSNWMQTISFTPKEKKLEILNELDKRLGKEKESYIKLAYEW